MKTWIISMKQIAQENPCAEQILNTVAFLDNQGLPFEVLCAAGGPAFSKREVLEAAGRLVDYSFLQAQIILEDATPTYQEHRLVQLATRQALSKAQRNREFSSYALQIMTDLFPDGTHETWSSCRVYLPHALKSLTWKDAGYIAPGLLARIGRYHWEEGRSKEAEELEVQVLDLRKSVLGEKHPDTIRAMANLAVTYHIRHHYDEAEKLEVNVLNLRRQILGNKHPDTKLARENLAATYRQQGRYDKVEELELQV